MKRTIWIPLVLSVVLGFLDFISIGVDFLIPLGPFGATGPQEILLIMSAALGGPLGALVSGFLQELGVYLFWLKTQFPTEQMLSTGVLFSLADFIAHLLALLTVAYGFRWLHQRVKKVIPFLVGWILILVIYYTVLVFFQSLLLGLVIQIHHPLSTLFQNNLPEFLVVTGISTLIWIALPKRFYRPLWMERQPAALPGGNNATPEEKS